MKKLVQALMQNTIVYSLLSLIVYAFYAAVIGISIAPAIYLLHMFITKIGIATPVNMLLFALTIGASVYITFIVSLFVFAIVEKILMLGVKPGKYSTSSLTFFRWLITSGLHVVLLTAVLPFMVGTPWATMFYKIIGCKIGKNVFINTARVFDAYLLEIDDNVVVGGYANITCHIFEGNNIILGKIKIGSNTLIAGNTFIMPGVTIGKHCNIGLYSYVRKNKTIEDNSMIMAIPGLDVKKVAEIVKE